MNFFTKLVEFLMPSKKQNQYKKPQEPPKTYTNIPKATSATSYSSPFTSNRAHPRESSQKVRQRDTFDDDVVPNTLILSTLANSASTDTRHDTPLSTTADSCVETKLSPSFDTSWSSSSSSDSTSTSDSGGGCSSSD